MIEKVVENLLESQKKQGILSDETIPIYRYGYTLIMEVCINFMLALSLGLAVHEIGIVLAFNLFFVPLRGFCGGWHAEKSSICTLVSSFVLAISVIFGKFELIQYKSYLWIAVMTVALLVILHYAPLDSAAKRLSSNEIKHYRGIIRLILLVEIVCFVGLFYIQQYKYAGMVSCVLDIQACSLLVSVIKTRAFD